jgi:transposase
VLVPLTAGAHVLVKTILNHVHPLQSFVYGLVAFVGDDLHVEVRPRKGARPRCGGCGRRGPTYDTAQKPRAFAFVPLWGLAVTLWYCMRRVACRRCGVTTERVPWAEGKQQTCNVYRLFLARWAKRLSWSEVAATFGTSWGVVYRAVQWVVAYGLAHRTLDGVQAIGVDEIAVWAGQKYLTVVYQIDRGARRLLWIGRDRTEATFHRFFDTLGDARAKALQFIASDMWRAFRNAITKRAPQALHVLDRYHVVAKLQEAVDRVRATEAKALARRGYEPVLKQSRWCFLKRTENLTPRQRRKLRDVLQYDLKTVRAYLLKESFEGFWRYTSPAWAGWFLDKWCARAMRSRLVPMKKVARMLRRHRALLLNWFRARGEISNGVAEGLNLNAKFALRKARGFRSYDVLETALYHQLGHLPEPVFTHRFC